MMTVSAWRRLGFAVACSAALFTAGVGCGGGESFCGDGERNVNEDCDDGNDIDDDGCTNECVSVLPARFTVSWQFNENPVYFFTGDSCFDLGVREVEVTISGPVEATILETCSLRNAVFLDLPEGSYDVEVRPLDRDGNLMTNQAITDNYDFVDGQQVFVNVPPDAWRGDFVGDFFFRFQWDGQDCDTASPAVAQHRLLMVQDGEPLTITTELGHPLDGSGAGSCQLFRDEFPQSIKDAPFGVAQFTIQGLDSAGDVQYEGVFETFLGAGLSNPELHFDISPINQ